MNYTESARVQQQIRGANGMLYIPGTSNPGQPGKRDRSRFCGYRIKLVVRIYYGTDLSTLGGGSENMQQAGRTAGRAAAGDFGYCATT